MQHGLLPLFPLEVVLMPGAHLPLHIFEDRYKEMIGEAWRDKTEFGIILATRDGLEDTGCTAAIEGILKEYPDGRLDIITRGRRRFELLLVNEERSFLRGAVEFFDDDEAPSEEHPDASGVEEHRKIAAAAYNTLQRLWKNQPLEDDAYTDPKMSFRVARAIRDLPFRQSLLKLRRKAERMAKIAEYLPPVAARVEQEQTIRDAAPHNGNGHYRNGNGTGRH